MDTADSGYMLQKSLDGGFRPPKEARDIQAALEREHELLVERIREAILRRLRGGAWTS